MRAYFLYYSSKGYRKSLYYALYIIERRAPMMKIVICDDELEYCTKAKVVIERYLKSRNIAGDITYCMTGDELLKQDNVDVIFMDIHLKNENGIDVIKLVNKKWPRTVIVYLTNHIIYASAVYVTKHSFFVIKDEFEERLDEIFDKILTDLSQHPQKLIFTNKGEEFLSLMQNDIIYIERKDRITYIHTQKEIYEVQEKISDIMERLPHLYFLRCHNSYIVYIPMIKELLKNEIILDNGQIVPVSRNYRKSTQDAFALWAATQMR